MLKIILKNVGLVFGVLVTATLFSLFMLYAQHSGIWGLIALLVIIVVAAVVALTLLDLNYRKKIKANKERYK